MAVPPSPEASEALGKKLERYRKQWDANARLDALWAVLTVDGTLGNGWDHASFFATGEQEIDEVFRFLDSRGLRPPTIPRALDFGCGVGRLTSPLARRASSVVGLDISEEMILRARGFFPDLDFRLNQRDDLGDFSDGEFDLIYSNIVLQHLHPDVQRHYIREFARVSRPGGLVIFQVPDARPAGSRAMKALRMAAKLSPARSIAVLKRMVEKKVAPWRAGMELNVMPKVVVLSVAESSGLAVRAVADLDWKTFYDSRIFRLLPEGEAAPDPDQMPSHLYFCQKPA